ncbi:hypothetical protein HY493_03880 [Candidatus Woesearchaeota archaeon]|nr:hypothetical protein [Candidatus Woesearchaeota archaeon]
MKVFTSIELSVFAKPEEDVEKLKQGLLALVPFDPAEENVELRDKKATGFNDRTIHVFDITLTKDRHVNAFVESFLAKLNAQQRGQLVDETESRLDNELVFFVRIDKDLWANDRIVQLTDSGACYHLKFSVASFPRRREIAQDIVTKVFKPA